MEMSGAGITSLLICFVMTVTAVWGWRGRSAPYYCLSLLHICMTADSLCMEGQYFLTNLPLYASHYLAMQNKHTHVYGYQQEKIDIREVRKDNRVDISFC